MNKMPFKKTVGDLSLTVYKDGWPLSIRLENEGKELRLFGIEQLHDLRYLVDRALVDVSAGETK